MLSIPEPLAPVSLGVPPAWQWPSVPFGGVGSVRKAGSTPGIEAILRQADPITLAEMDGVALLNRVDTKFTMTSTQLCDALASVAGQYRVLHIDEVRVHAYRTLYFDTATLELYLHHHAGRGNRYKVRSRQYLQSKAAFLEVKQKTKGRTKKCRIGTDALVTDLAPDDSHFVHQTVPGGLRLVPILFNSFKRVTLVSRQATERLTLDTDISFADCATGRSVSLDGLAVAEVKQDGRGQRSGFVERMRALGVRQSSFSKYCIGVALLRQDVKHNRFKRTLGVVGKLLDDPSVLTPPSFPTVAVA